MSSVMLTPVAPPEGVEDASVGAVVSGALNHAALGVSGALYGSWNILAARKNITLKSVVEVTFHMRIF